MILDYNNIISGGHRNKTEKTHIAATLLKISITTNTIMTVAECCFNVEPMFDVKQYSQTHSQLQAGENVIFV